MITSRAASNTDRSSQPHITVSWPFSAPAWPPDTGASTNPRPRAAHSAASSRATVAEAVVWSTNVAPGLHRLDRRRRHLADVVVVADAHHHELGTLDRLGRGGRRAVAVLGNPLERLGGGAVVDGDLVAGRRKVAGHRPAHHTETEKRDS